MPPSADAYKAIHQDSPSDWRRRPGRPRQSWLAPYTELCRNWILTWTMFLNLLPIVYSGACYWWWWHVLLASSLMCSI